MTKIAIPPDLAGMFTACEDAYEQATQEGYPENPAVVAAIADLKSAWKALHVANYNLMTAKGFFAAEFATVRTERACRATTEACIKLHAAIGLAALEHRLDNRCLTLASQSATPAPDQGGGKRATGWHHFRDTASDQRPFGSVTWHTIGGPCNGKNNFSSV